MKLPYFLTDTLTLGALAVCVMLALLALILRRNTHWLSHIQRKALLTPNEIHFFHRLQRALPTYHVFPQVSFAAFLTDDGKLSRNARWSLRGRFDRKIADFVICERDNMNIIALVELDDSTHVASADRQRDAITKAAGYQTIRFQSRRKPSEAEIASLFQHAQAWR
jgi:polyisoprenoid-binding protein YceI